MSSTVKELTTQDDPDSDNPEGEKSAKRQRTTTTAMFSSQKKTSSQQQQQQQQQKSSSRQQTDHLEEVIAEDVNVEIDTQKEDAGGDKNDWDDMTYREGEISLETGGFDVSDVEDDDVFDDVLRDPIQTEEQIRDPTAKKLDCMFSDLHEWF